MDSPEDLDQLQQWTKQWLLQFDAAKCKVMHMKHNLGTKYELQDNGNQIDLQVTTEERDVGVIITADLKPA